jgi:hypothetical protein
VPGKLLPPLATIGQIGVMKNACCALCGRAAPGLTRHGLVPRTLHKRACTRRNFSRAERYTCILLCRPCHKQIHAVFTESELAREYASTEALAAKSPALSSGSPDSPPTADIPRAPQACLKRNRRKCQDFLRTCEKITKCRVAAGFLAWPRREGGGNTRGGLVPPEQRRSSQKTRNPVGSAF